MKKILLLLLVLPVYIFAQRREVFRIDSLPKEGVELNKGWRWHTGDDPDFAKPNFDDSQWESIDPSQKVSSMPVIPKGINWFRLHLSINQDLLNQMVIMVRQSGASEIYINGKLIHKIGKISQNFSKIEVINPRYKSFSFPCNDDSVQVLAVRFTLHPGMLYSRMFSRSYDFLCLRLITPYDATELGYQLFGSNDERTIARFSLFLLLGVLYFALFLFNKSKKVYLYFSLYALSYAFIWYTFYFENKNEHLVYWFHIDFILLIIQIASVFILLKAVYDLMEQKLDLLFYSIIIIGLLSIPSSIWLENGFLLFSIGFFTMANLVILIAAIKAFLGNKKGAWIIAIGGVVYLISWVMFILQTYGLISPNQPFQYFEVAFYSVPIAVAIYLGYESGLTNSILQQKLFENEALSAEKQQILSSQNEILEREVAKRTVELKASQAQLIQSEKLASLGELTAGIAHEIQNPLNFVNNFAEVSAEMLGEMEEELEKGDTQEAKAIASDLKQNLSKINHHGQRASSIVKGMLEHSRTSTGVKEPTDLNALADEYLRLAYHGLRAKDNSFNATMEAHFDPDLPLVSVIPQDIGRVLLNLINNAFYAVAERSRSTVNEKAKQVIEDYSPTVTVSTKKLENAIEISVKDNGNGIPEVIKDKIFQPFFTTKPTGQGTGLGLSLAYDIVTKGHGGNLDVNSLIGEGTEFIIRLVFEPG